MRYSQSLNKGGNQIKTIGIQHGVVCGLRVGYWPEIVADILERRGLRDPDWLLFDFCDSGSLKSDEDPADMVAMLARLNREYRLPRIGRRVASVFLPATTDPSLKMINTIAQARASGIQCVILAKRNFNPGSIPTSILHQMTFQIDHDTALNEPDPEIIEPTGFWRKRFRSKNR